MPRPKKPDSGVQGLLQSIKRSQTASSRVSDGLVKLIESHAEFEASRQALREAFLQAACADDVSDRDTAIVTLLADVFPEGEIIAPLLRNKNSALKLAAAPDTRPVATA